MRFVLDDNEYDKESRTLLPIGLVILTLVVAMVASTILFKNPPAEAPNGHIVVDTGDHKVDRGTDTDYSGVIEHMGPWRLQEESFGKTLYLYHASGQLRARIINPVAVLGSG